MPGIQFCRREIKTKISDWCVDGLLAHWVEKRLLGTMSVYPVTAVSRTLDSWDT